MHEIKTVQAFKTSDNKIFEDSKKAIEHQEWIDFQDWYYNNKLYGNYEGSYVSAVDLIVYLKMHKERLKILIGG